MQSFGYGLEPQVLLARSEEDGEDVGVGFCYPFDGCSQVISADSLKSGLITWIIRIGWPLWS